MSKLTPHDLEKILESKKPLEERQDQAVWAFLTDHDFPLSREDKATWTRLDESRVPAARMVSDVRGALGEIELLYPNSKITTDMIGPTSRVDLEIPSIIGPLKEQRKNPGGALSFGAVMAQAFCAAHERATEINRKVDALGFDPSNVLHPETWATPESGWTIEYCKGSFRCIHRELRLASTGFRDEEAMARNASSLHWNSGAAINMRDRFDNLTEAGFIPEEETSPEDAPNP